MNCAPVSRRLAGRYQTNSSSVTICRSLTEGTTRVASSTMSCRSDRAAALTQQLLAFGRNQMIQPTVVDLREVLDSTGRMLQRLLGEHIELAIVPGPIVSSVFADRGQLGQILVNLAVNGRDAMPHGGRLTIEA